MRSSCCVRFCSTCYCCLLRFDPGLVQWDLIYFLNSYFSKYHRRSSITGWFGGVPGVRLDFT